MQELNSATSDSSSCKNAATSSDGYGGSEGRGFSSVATACTDLSLALLLTASMKEADRAASSQPTFASFCCDGVLEASHVLEVPNWTWHARLLAKPQSRKGRAREASVCTVHLVLSGHARCDSAGSSAAKSTPSLSLSKEMCSARSPCFDASATTASPTPKRAVPANQCTKRKKRRPRNSSHDVAPSAASSAFGGKGLSSRTSGREAAPSP